MSQGKALIAGHFPITCRFGEHGRGRRQESRLFRPDGFFHGKSAEAFFCGSVRNGTGRDNESTTDPVPLTVLSDCSLRFSIPGIDPICRLSFTTRWMRLTTLPLSSVIRYRGRQGGKRTDGLAPAGHFLKTAGLSDVFEPFCLPVNRLRFCPPVRQNGAIGSLRQPLKKP